MELEVRLLTKLYALVGYSFAKEGNLINNKNYRIYNKIKPGAKPKKTSFWRLDPRKNSSVVSLYYVL